MGGLISRIKRVLWSSTPQRILMNGLDAAGKTTILYKLKLGEIVTTIPTIGFNVETVEYRNISFTVWDVGGRDKIRPLWRHYYSNTNALIWVVDSNDRERLGGTGSWQDDDYGTTRAELHKSLAESELRDAPVLIFANKQDLPNAMSVQEITERLGLHSLRERDWMVQGCCATNGDGLYEGLDWLSNVIRNPKKRAAAPAPAPSRMVQIGSNTPSAPAKVAPSMPAEIKPVVAVNHSSTLAVAPATADAASTGTYPSLVQSWPPASPSIPVAESLTQQPNHNSASPSMSAYLTASNASNTPSFSPTSSFVLSGSASIAPPYEDLAAMPPQAQLEVLYPSKISMIASKPVADSEFIIVESIEQPAPLIDSDEVWLNSNGEEVPQRQTQTAKNIALRMIEEF